MEKQHQILLVVNHYATRKILKSMLLVEGYTIAESDNGKDALHLAKEIKPSLIIQDEILPDDDSIKLIEAFRKLPEFSETPIFALVGFLKDNPSTSASKHLFNEVLIKPVPLKLLSYYVRLYLKEGSQNIKELFELNDPLRLKAQVGLLYTLTYLFSTNRRNLDHALEEVLGYTLDSTGIHKGMLFLKNKNAKWYLHQFTGFLAKDKDALEGLFESFTELKNRATSNQIIKLDKQTLDKSQQDLLEKLGIHSAIIVPVFIKNECIGMLFLVANTNQANLLSTDAEIFATFLAKHIAQVIQIADQDTHLISFEQLNKVLLDTVSCGVLLIDKQGVIKEINHQVENLFGQPSDNIIGKTYLTYIAPQELNSTKNLIEILLTEKKFGPAITTLKHDDGKTIELEYYISAITINNESMYMAVINNISELRRLRKQTLLNDKLAMVGTLTAGIIHEVNNPIAWVLTNLNFLKERLKKYEEDINNYSYTKDEPFKHIAELKKELTNYYELVTESLDGANQIKEIVRDLKGFSRADEGAEVFVDVHDILNTALKIAATQCKNKIKIEQYYATNIPKSMFERGKLQQVFLNIIINAVQSLEKCVNKENVLQVKTYLQDNQIYIDIADNGPGIPPDILPKIFDAFFTTKPMGEGTGLGLSICKDIIEHANGKITVRSEIGKGTIFTIILPVKPEKKLVEEKKNAFTNDLITPVKILIVDDEPTILKTVHRILENQHKVTIAHGGQIALDLLEKSHFAFDIIITDLSMPHVNGIDIYNYLRERANGLEKHVIFMTGGTDSITAKKFLASINNVCVPKPFTKEELLHAIASAVGIPL